MRVTPYIIVNAGDMSSNVTSLPIQLDQDFGYSVQAVWAGTPSGTFLVEVSNDKLTWVIHPQSPVTFAGQDGTIMWNINGTMNYFWARLIFISSSGPGLLTATAKINGV